jgi:hypothetical protein
METSQIILLSAAIIAIAAFYFSPYEFRVDDEEEI